MLNMAFAEVINKASKESAVMINPVSAVWSKNVTLFIINTQNQHPRFPCYRDQPGVFLISGPAYLNETSESS